MKIPKLRQEPIRPSMKLARISVRERVLVLCAAHPVFDREILNRLHIQFDAVDCIELGLKSSDHFRCCEITIGFRLEVDLDSPRVQNRVRSVDADERREAVDRRILQDDVGKFLLSLGHRFERNALRRL
jgi:hypothetical protein